MRCVARIPHPAAALLIPVACLAACTDDRPVGPEDAPAGPSRAFAAWSPGPHDTCTPEIHDQYAVVGPDGKLYPTWHPPVDPATGCIFGHEHGRDPRGSDLFSAVGPIPFGYANEAVDLFAPHVGYKIEWENDVEMRFDGAGDAVFDVRCDVLVALHQGTGGGGAFVNPLHELQFAASCGDGTQLHVAFVTTIDTEGVFHRSCEGDVEIVVAALENPRDGGGRRLIPDRTCVESNILVVEGERSNYNAALRESWQFSESIRTAEGRRLVSLGPYFNVRNPSRYHDPAAPDGVGRTIDLCYEVTEDGRRAREGLCEEATAGGTITDIAWDDPRSPFNGAHRDVDINRIRITNADGPSVWYTDGFGENGRTEPFPGSIRQVIAAIDNSAVAPSGPAIGRNRNYGEPGTGVHAPN